MSVEAMKHTKGPWVVYTDGDAEGQHDSDIIMARVGDENYDIAYMATDASECRPSRERRANARRIVNCLNACERIPDPDKTIKETLSALEGLIKEADDPNNMKDSDFVAAVDWEELVRKRLESKSAS